MAANHTVMSWGLGAADRESQPGHAVAAAERGVGLEETLEQMGEVALLDADAAVVDAERHLAARAVDAQRHAAGVGELHGVVGQAVQDAADARGVAQISSAG